MAVAIQREEIQPIGEIVQLTNNRSKKRRNCLERKLRKILWRWEMRWVEDSPDAHELILKRLLRLKRRYTSLQGLDELGRLTREVQIEVAFHLMTTFGNRGTHKTESHSERMRVKKRRKERRQSRKPRGEIFRRPVYIHF